MKKLFTLLATMIVAFTLVAPVYAQKKEAGGAHEMHAKNAKSHGKKKGKKKGQQETNPGQKEGQETPKAPEAPK